MHSGRISITETIKDSVRQKIYKEINLVVCQCLVAVHICLFCWPITALRSSGICWGVFLICWPTIFVERQVIWHESRPTFFGRVIPAFQATSTVAESDHHCAITRSRSRRMKAYGLIIASGCLFQADWPAEQGFIAGWTSQVQHPAVKDTNASDEVAVSVRLRCKNCYCWSLRYDVKISITAGLHVYSS